MTDVINSLRELRQSSKGSVVNGSDDESPLDRPTIPHPIEHWLVELILEEMTRPDGRRYSLILLSGNAGDGKSHLLRSVRARLKREGVGLGDVEWVLDATHSDGPRERAVDRLSRFFFPFMDGQGWNPAKLHIVAINTGAAVQFMGACGDRFRDLDRILRGQMGMQAIAEGEWSDAFRERFDRVLVVDLDRRGLVQLDEGARQYVDEMLDLLDPNNQRGLLAQSDPNCATCAQAPRCPVNANLIALRFPAVRVRLKTLLLDIALEDRIHIGPRGLWHLAYRLSIGGLDDARITAARPLINCKEIGQASDEELTRGLFFSGLFSDAESWLGQENPGLSTELARMDPSLRFSLSGHEAALVAGLSPEEDRVLAEELARTLGLSAEALCGSPDEPEARARAAVRRAFFLQSEEPDALRHAWLKEWASALDRVRNNALAGVDVRENEVHKRVVDVLREMYRPQTGEHPNLWQLKLPWRGRRELFTLVHLRPGQLDTNRDCRILGPDVYRPGSMRPDVAAMAEALGAYPLTVPIPLREGPKIDVNWSLYRLLMRVATRGYVAGSLDPERIQHLERVGASVGALAAEQSGVAVFNGVDVLQIEGVEGGGYLVFAL